MFPSIFTQPPKKNQPEGWRCLAETMGLPCPKIKGTKELLPQRSHLDRGQKLTGPALGTWKAVENLSKRAPLVGFVPKRAEKEDLRPGFHSNKNI